MNTDDIVKIKYIRKIQLTTNHLFIIKSLLFFKILYQKDCISNVEVKLFNQ